MNPLPSSRAKIVFLSALLAWVFLSFGLAAENEVIVVSPHWDGIKEETSRAFSAWHEKKYGEPATIRWHETGGGTSQIVRFLNAEYKTSSSAGIDVLYGGGVDPYHELEKDGLLTPYDPPADILAAIPAQLNGMELYDPAHEWFGAALSGFGIITNERVREAVGLPEVHAWADLADPRLAGWISACDPRFSGSALTIYEIILQSCGWDKGWAILTEMSGNVRNFLASSAASAVEVGMGDAAYGVAIDSYGNAQAGYYGPENVTFLLPEGQTMIDPDSIAILKNPPHAEMARHFLEFVLSREGQLLWMLPKGAPGGATRNIINHMSVQPALYDELAGKTPILTNPFKMRNDFVYSNDLGAKRRAILSVLIATWMIDTHDSLAPAWRALNSPAAQKLPDATRQALLAQLTAPPCTEAELLRLATTDWKDPVKRTALTNRWQSAALDRYKSVLAQIKAK
jgi:ABC-type Fe3+ transport system substrate-binding protein